MIATESTSTSSMDVDVDKPLPATSSWAPPTPDSTFTPLSHHLPPPPALGHFDPLPPPLTAFPAPATTSKSSAKLRRPPAASAARSSSSSSSSSISKLLNREDDTADPRRATPHSLTVLEGPVGRTVGPVRGFFNDTQQDQRPALELDDIRLSPLVKPVTLDDDTYGSGIRKRPRREASIAAKLALRQPSPLELESPPLRATGTTSTTAGGSQSNRKVSHSLIERRRREKINDCLAALKIMVPQCREQGERKEARARERGRKRGGRNADADEDSSRGGLHKLEILQGTIAYIEELEARVVSLEDAFPFSPPDVLTPAPDYSSGDTSSGRSSPEIARTISATPDAAAVNAVPDSTSTSREEMPPPPLRRISPPSLAPLLSTSMPINQHTFVSANDEDTAAGLLLLKFSTSPELRPVFYD